MEAVGAASSITALLTIAVQSSKIVYETVTTIRDGPNELHTLAAAVEDLHLILKHIVGITTSENFQLHLAPEHAGLKRSMRNCISDLTDVQNGIVKMRPAVQDRTLDRARKRVLMVLWKKDIERMWGIIERHTNNLSLQLTIGNMDLSLSNISSSYQLQSTMATGFQTIENTTRTCANLHNIQSTEQYAILQRQAEAQHQQSIEHQDRGNQETINVLKESFILMEEKFKQLEIMLKNSEGENQRSQQITNLPAPNGALVERSRLNENFTKSLDRLYNFIPQRGKKMSARNAGKVVDEIDTILDIIGILRKPAPVTADFDTILDVVEKLRLASPTRKSDGVQNHEWDNKESIGKPISTRCLKTMKAIARMTTKVSVTDGSVSKLKVSEYSDPATVRRLQDTPQSFTNLQIGLETYNTSDGTLIVWSKSMEANRNSPTTQPFDFAMVNDGKTEKFFLAGIHFVPSYPSRSAILSALFTQRITSQRSQFLDFSISFHGQNPLKSRDLDGFILFLLSIVASDQSVSLRWLFSHTCPAIYVCISTQNMRSDGSEVFTSVKDGNLERLKHLLQIGLASLRDCDSEGRSLITIAVFYVQFGVLNFLLQNGADISRFESTGMPLE